MTHHLWAGHIAQVVECLPSLHEALGLTSSIILGMVYVSNPTASELERGSSKSPLVTIFKASLGYIKEVLS